MLTGLTNSLLTGLTSGLALLLVFAAAGPDVAVAEITFQFSKDNEATLGKFTIDSGRAEVSMFRAVWSNTHLVTQGGQRVSVTDPFMYQCTVLVDGQQKGGYWNAPEIWDDWQVTQAQDANRPYDDLLKIVAEPPGWGVRKEVSIAVNENESRAYVFSRLTATSDLQLHGDNQTIYVDTSTGNKFFVDDQPVDPEHSKQVPIAHWIMIYYWNQYVSVGLIAMDPQLQEYPNPQVFGDVTFSESADAKGASISLRKGSGAMLSGDSRSQQYLLVWGDGDLRSKIQEISKQALAGELNSNVLVLPVAK